MRGLKIPPFQRFLNAVKTRAEELLRAHGPNRGGSVTPIFLSEPGPVSYFAVGNLPEGILPEGEAYHALALHALVQHAERVQFPSPRDLR
jgi:hypothetical protein